MPNEELPFWTALFLYRADLSEEQCMNRKQKRILLIAGLALLLLGIGCGIYAGTYSHASPEAAALLQGVSAPT